MNFKFSMFWRKIAVFILGGIKAIYDVKMFFIPYTALIQKNFLLSQDHNYYHVPSSLEIKHVMYSPAISSSL